MKANLNPKPNTRRKHWKGSSHFAPSISMKINPRKCSQKAWAWRLKTAVVTKSKLIIRSGWGWRWRLLGSKHPARSHVFSIVTKSDGHWRALAHSFLPKNSTTFPSILTRLKKKWIETTHFFIKIIKPIIILLILLHTFRGILCLWPYLITKMEELATTLFYI